MVTLTKKRLIFNQDPLAVVWDKNDHTRKWSVYENEWMIYIALYIDDNNDRTMCVGYLERYTQKCDND